MSNNNKSGILLYLCLFIAGVMVIPTLASCGKENTTTSNLNARLNIVDVSPDAPPFNLYARYLPVGTTVYRYPNASGYFLISTAEVPLQIRRAQTTNGVDQTNLLSLSDS